MSDMAVITITIIETQKPQWQALFAASQKSGFGAKFEIALEALSTSAAQAFETLMEECGGELGVIEDVRWDNAVTCRFECELVGCDYQEFASILEAAGAINIEIDEVF